MNFEPDLDTNNLSDMDNSNSYVEDEALLERIKRIQKKGDEIAAPIIKEMIENHEAEPEIDSIDKWVIKEHKRTPRVINLDFD